MSFWITKYVTVMPKCLNADKDEMGWDKLTVENKCTLTDSYKIVVSGGKPLVEQTTYGCLSTS